MTLGEIPVDMLTHLNIAFGYIDHDFKITNMDGVSPDLYRNVGNLKAKNPDLKVIIALGGWTFSDPGTKWQNIFPSLTSSRANRAIFIKNLLGFLSQYGYDGVDFDWEYPGAKDRGGSGQDAVNYVSLVKELRSAIESSGQDYIITFTAPTSYWYLRHFDPKGMEPYVDWINLMSYDLHGTWDSDNPIGSQVLAHSNLTEIDLALDLFWRVGVKPQNIVLGLGFYGRSFKLKSSSCWKPGCRFSGPGDKGPCTDTAGILSYREIQNILSKTGATSYHDKTAAVRYFVYNDNSWISYDDKETFKSKIEYANEMGLSGLMIWAIDQDDNDLSALSAVTDGVARNQSVDNFDLVDLKHIFPKDVMPADISDPHYGIITFGSGSESGELDPTNSGFGFLLAVGESHGLSQLRKREGKPEPFVFLDCPDNVFSHPINKTQKARVERGVEGTLVEMPDDCAPNSFARAISLEVARGLVHIRPIPESFASRSAPTSQVFEFSFDFDKLETRGDAKIAVRMDATNVKAIGMRLSTLPVLRLGALRAGIGGMGRLDIDQAGQGNPVHKENTTRGRDRTTRASFNGRLTARVESDFGNYAAIFPNTIDSEDIKRATEKRKKSIVTSARDDILYSGGGEDGSTITLGHYLTFGVSVDFVLPALIQGQPEHWTHPVDMMVQAQTLAQWVIAKDESSKACTDFSALNFFYQFAEGEDNFGWDDQGETMFYSETIDSNEPFCWAVDKSKRSLLDVPSSVNSTNLTAPTHLIKRGSKNPKDNWGVQFLNPNDALRMGADQFVQQHVDQSMGNIDCDNGRCTSCLDVEESRDCCGCVCMVCVWGARGDIEDCAECSSGADGIWPGNSVLKRSHSMATIGEGDGSDEVFDEDELTTSAPEYPAFPADVNKPWDGADGGKWDSISRYWGNASADCSDWTILKKATADVVHVGNGVTQRADYESEQFLLCCILFKDTERLTSCFSIAEHVYEAQFLSQFFTTWLVEGKVKRQRPAPGTTVGKVDCKWVSDWIIEADNSYPWEDPAGKEDIFSLLQLLHSELGNMVHQDRLTIALGRLNNKKQNLFGHKNTYQEKGYKRMSSDEQLQLVKEHGLLFNYMNHDDVWEMWCDTYNAMRVHLVEFDKWYPKSKGDPDVTLADEWDKYHRVALDSIVLRSRETWKWLYDNRR
ncbi:Chitotriosidase-1 [Fusarium oxysporum f. sp. conglutinans]|nr:Chitotriosidase-1 [Fusarium oxysporum f. sp. conglutinans]